MKVIIETPVWNHPNPSIEEVYDEAMALPLIEREKTPSGKFKATWRQHRDEAILNPCRLVSSLVPSNQLVHHVLDFRAKHPTAYHFKKKLILVKPYFNNFIVYVMAPDGSSFVNMGPKNGYIMIVAPYPFQGKPNSVMKLITTLRRFENPERLSVRVKDARNFEFNTPLANLTGELRVDNFTCSLDEGVVTSYDGWKSRLSLIDSSGEAPKKHTISMDQAERILGDTVVDVTQPHVFDHQDIATILSTAGK